MNSLLFFPIVTSPLFPGLPLISATPPEFKITNWFGVVGPGGLPAEWTAFWNRAINTIA